MLNERTWGRRTSILPDLIANNRNALPVTYFVHRNGFCLISGCLDMQLEYVA